MNRLTGMPARLRPIGLLAPLMMSFGSAVSAEAPSTTVTVRATQVSEAESRAPTAFVDVIDAEQHAEQVETVSDALAESVGVSVRRFGGLGAFSTLSIRGSSANQVQVYLDGVPLARARNETVNLGDLPLDSLQRIEVYRGTIPASFGSGAIGGVVNLVTKTPSATPETEAGVSYGSFETRKVTASHSRSIGGFELLGFVTYLGSKGDFSFPDDNDTPLNPTDDTTATRANNGFDSVDGLLKAAYELRPGLRAELTSETFFKATGVPGRGSVQSLDASFDELRAFNYLRLRSSDFLTRGVDCDATLYGIYEKAEFQDPPPGTIGTGVQDRHDQTGVVGGNVSGTYYAPPVGMLGNTVGWFAELSHETFAPKNDAPHAFDEPDEQRLHATLVGQNQIGVWSDTILLIPTFRYEHIRDEADGTLRAFGRPAIPAQTRDHDLWSPSIGAQIRLQPWLSLRGNIGRYERAPNFDELFGNSGSLFGNPTLKPETALNRDVGFVLDGTPAQWAREAHLEYAYFNNDVDELIVLLAESRASATHVNVSGARLRGHEVSGRITLADHFRVAANYTHQDAENRNQLNGGIYLGNQLPSRPSDEVYARLDVLVADFKVYYEFNFVGGNFIQQSNFRELPSRTIHTLGATWQALEPLQLGFEARNLTDNQISDVGDFPLPGRAFFGTVKVKF